MLNINLGDYVRTPRFCAVKISALFASEESARRAGYTEPTHFDFQNPNAGYNIVGKSTSLNHFEFAAYLTETE